MAADFALVAYVVIAVALLWPLVALVVYPTWLVGRGRIGSDRAVEPAWPAVTVVVAARDAVDRVEDKVGELLALDYPAAKLRVIVVSDGSVDGTADAAQRVHDERLEVIALAESVGKTAAVNTALERASADWLAFSDVSTRWEAGALKALVRRGLATDAGCVSGRIAYGPSTGPIGLGFAMYQRFETALRQLAGGAGLLPSVSGAMHLVRRRHCRPLPSSLTADLALPLLVQLDGARVTYAVDAVGHERPRDDLGREFDARVRIANRAIESALKLAPRLLTRRCGAVLFALFCHKVLRWSVWVPAALIFAASIALATSHWLWLLFALLQAVVYGAGLLHARFGVTLLPRRLQAFASYWTLANAALALGGIAALRGRSTVAWKTSP